MKTGEYAQGVHGVVDTGKVIIVTAPEGILPVRLILLAYGQCEIRKYYKKRRKILGFVWIAPRARDQSS